MAFNEEISVDRLHRRWRENLCLLSNDPCGLLPLSIAQKFGFLFFYTRPSPVAAASSSESFSSSYSRCAVINGFYDFQNSRGAVNLSREAVAYNLIAVFLLLLFCFHLVTLPGSMQSPSAAHQGIAVVIFLSILCKYSMVLSSIYMKHQQSFRYWYSLPYFAFTNVPLHVGSKAKCQDNVIC